MWGSIVRGGVDSIFTGEGEGGAFLFFDDEGVRGGGLGRRGRDWEGPEGGGGRSGRRRRIARRGGKGTYEDRLNEGTVGEREGDGSGVGGGGGSPVSICMAWHCSGEGREGGRGVADGGEWDAGSKRKVEGETEEGLGKVREEWGGWVGEEGRGSGGSIHVQGWGEGLEWGVGWECEGVGVVVRGECQGRSGGRGVQ